LDRDAAQRTGATLAEAQLPLGNDALEVLSGRLNGEALSDKQWHAVGDYLRQLTIESYSTDEDAIELCPRCGCVLARQDGDYWVCSGALYESEAIVPDGSKSGRPLSERLWPLAEQPDELRHMWQEQCGGSRVYLPSEAPRRTEFLFMVPNQLIWPLTFDELVVRMATLYRQGSFSPLNSTVRPKHLRRTLDKLREQGVVRILIGADGAARFQRVRGARATADTSLVAPGVAH